MGLADYFCHRATGISHTSGTPESLMHLAQFALMGLPLTLAGKIDPSFVITHRCALDDAPQMYEVFKKKEDGCVKVIMRPNG